MPGVGSSYKPRLRKDSRHSMPGCLELVVRTMRRCRLRCASFRFRRCADNYIWLLADAAGNALIVDPGEAAPVLATLQRERLAPCRYPAHASPSWTISVASPESWGEASGPAGRRAA